MLLDRKDRIKWFGIFIFNFRRRKSVTQLTDSCSFTGLTTRKGERKTISPGTVWNHQLWKSCHGDKETKYDHFPPFISLPPFLPLLFVSFIHLAAFCVLSRHQRRPLMVLKPVSDKLSWQQSLLLLRPLLLRKSEGNEGRNGGGRIYGSWMDGWWYVDLKVESGEDEGKREGMIENVSSWRVFLLKKEKGLQNLDPSSMSKSF